MARDRQLLSISVPEYHGLPMVSSGMIRCYAMSGPWMTYAKYVERSITSEESDAKRMGSAFHMAMEKPDRWMDHFEIMPALIEGEPVNLRLKKHREHRDLLAAKAAMHGKQFVHADEVADLQHMIQSVYENPACRKYVGLGHPVEVPGVAKDDATGLEIKALADVLMEDVIVDFKTTRHSTANDFVRDALQKGYDYQAAHYLNVFGRSKFVIIGVRNEPPFESMVYVVPQHRINKAMEANARVLKMIADCFAMNSWHSIGWGQETELTVAPDPLTGAIVL